MKSNASNRTLAHKRGITLLELTVVIFVLLILVSILFIGVTAWKRGSDRSKNIMNLRNAQQAMRGHANVFGIPIGGNIPQNDIFGANGYLRFPPNVATVIYNVPQQVATPYGVLYLQASADGAPAPRATPTPYGPFSEDLTGL